jgi:hypothetical protein
MAGLGLWSVEMFSGLLLGYLLLLDMVVRG